MQDIKERAFQLEPSQRRRQATGGNQWQWQQKEGSLQMVRHVVSLINSECALKFSHRNRLSPHKTITIFFASHVLESREDCAVPIFGAFLLDNPLVLSLLLSASKAYKTKVMCV